MIGVECTSSTRASRSAANASAIALIVPVSHPSETFGTARRVGIEGGFAGAKLRTPPE